MFPYCSSNGECSPNVRSNLWCITQRKRATPMPSANKYVDCIRRFHTYIYATFLITEWRVKVHQWCYRAPSTSSRYLIRSRACSPLIRSRTSLPNCRRRPLRFVSPGAGIQKMETNIVVASYKAWSDAQFSPPEPRLTLSCRQLASSLT
jgi:hypothetical protein